MFFLTVFAVPAVVEGQTDATESKARVVVAKFNGSARLAAQARRAIMAELADCCEMIAAKEYRRVRRDDDRYSLRATTRVEIAKELSADVIVLGRVRKRKGRYVLRIAAYGGATGERLINIRRRLKYKRARARGTRLSRATRRFLRGKSREFAAAIVAYKESAVDEASSAPDTEDGDDATEDEFDSSEESDEFEDDDGGFEDVGDERAMRIGPVDVTSLGKVSMESHLFQPDEIELTRDYELFLSTELRVDGNHRPWQELMRMYARVALSDELPSLFFFEDAWVGYTKPDYRLRVGLRSLSWSTNNIFQTADVVNSRYLGGFIESPAKIGEPMGSLGLRIAGGWLTGYYMPFVISPIFSSPASRTNLLGTADVTTPPVWIGQDGLPLTSRFEHQFGARFERTISGGDVALYFVQHHDRSLPTFSQDPVTMSLQPTYHLVKDYGATYTRVVGDVVVSMEFNHRDFPDFDEALMITTPLDHGSLAVSMGTSWSVGESAELSMQVEGQTLLFVNKEQRANLSLFQRDVAIAGQLLLDTKFNRTLSSVVLFDLEYSPQILATLQYSQRLNDTWTGMLGIRAIHAPPRIVGMPTGLEILHGANQAVINFSRFF